MSSLSRRAFLNSATYAAGALLLPFSVTSRSFSKEQSSITFGLVADPHADLIPDKNERIEAFVKQAIDRKVDFVIQLGDFCFPIPENKDFMGIWKQFKGPKHNVLGNHDMDVSSKEETMAYWEMPSRYYSFDQGGLHFVILDANNIYADGKYTAYNKANFYIDSTLRTYVDPVQIEWLIADLGQTTLPTLVFSHQSLINALWGIKNRLQIQQILEEANEKAGYQKVIACFNGHDHIDFHRQLNGIHYLEMNSMSYQWLGEKYSNKTRYPAELYEKYPALDKIAPYTKPLFSFIRVDATKGLLEIEGTKAAWLAPSPEAIGVPERVPGSQYSPEILDRTIKF